MVSQQISKEDIQAVISEIKNMDVSEIRIVSNPVYDKVLFSAVGDVNLEWRDSELGIRIQGKWEDGEWTDVYEYRTLDDKDFAEFANIVGAIENTPIMIWDFETAPVFLKNLSGLGGEETRVILIPPKWFGSSIDWLDRLANYIDPEVYILPGKWQVSIHAH